VANRYQELIDAIPTGTQYVAAGEILPLRNTPYEFRLETATPSRRFGIFVNGTFRGIVDSDTAGVAIVRVSLDQGQQDLVLRDSVTQRLFHSYLTIQPHATWMAAHADIFEDVDVDIANMRSALSLSTASSQYLGDVYGRALNQPNDAQYLTEAYRLALQEIRQAYRLWGARPAGLRQVVHALTDVNPLQVPRAWRSNWVADEQLAPNHEFTEFATLLDDTGFPLLNARSLDFVHAGFPGSLSPITVGTIADPPIAQELTVSFDAAWVAGTAGNVIIEGTDASGGAIIETFVKPGAASTVLGVNRFVFLTVTDIRLASTGAGNATVGVNISKYVTFVGASGPLVPAGGSLAHVLNFFAKAATILSFDALELDSGSRVEVPQSGRYTLPGTVGFGSTGVPATRLDAALVVSPPGASVTYGVQNRVRVELGDRGLVDVELDRVGGTGSSTLADVRDAINQAVAQETGYDATQATGTIVVTLAPGVGEEGKTIVIGDGRGNTLRLEVDSDNTVTAGNVPFIATGTNVLVAEDIRDQINNSGILIRAHTTVATPATVVLKAMYGGTAGNITITTTPVGGISVGGMAGGLQADTNHLTRARVLSNAVGDSLAIDSSLADFGELGAIALHGGGADATHFIAGFPRERSTLAALAAAAARVLDCSVAGTDALPLVPTIVVHDSLSATVITGPGPITAPDWASPLEVWFSPDFDGGNGVAEGADCSGAVVSDSFVYPGKKVADSGAASSAATIANAKFFQDGRSANSMGTLSQALIIGDGAASEVRLWALTPGTAGDAWDVTVVFTAAPSISLSVSQLGTTITVQLGTDGASAGDSAAVDVADVITNTLGITALAAPNGSGTGLLTAASAGTFLFGGAVEAGQVVELTNQAGVKGSYDFLDLIEPGMALRVLDGPFAGVVRRIAYVNGTVRAYPPSGFSAFSVFDATRALYLESSIGGSFLNASWEIVEAQVVQGETVFKTITAWGNTTVGTAGRSQLRIRGGVEDYGVPVRVGRGIRDSGVDGVVQAPGFFGASPTLTRLTAASYTPHPDDFGGHMDVVNAAANVAANRGLHRIFTLDPLDIVAAGDGEAQIRHELSNRNGRFTSAPATSTDWSSFIDEANLTWILHIAGEAAIMVGNNRGTGQVTLAEPGLHNSKVADGLVELAGSLPAERRGFEGLDRVIVDVDVVMAPVGPTVIDPITAQARAIPDGWRAFNVDEATAETTLAGLTSATRLVLEGDGGAVLSGNMLLERAVPEALSYRGFTLRLAAWTEQSSATGSVAWDVSFDGGETFSAGAGTTVPPSVLVGGEGGAHPTQVVREVLVPVSATGVVIRLRHTEASAAALFWALEKVTVTALTETAGAAVGPGYFLGEGTVARHETHQAFGELLYVWSSEGLLPAERVNLGLPEGAATTAATEGHIDQITNAHGGAHRPDHQCAWLLGAR